MWANHYTRLRCATYHWRRQFGSSACHAKTPHYFQVPTVVVLTQLPLKSVLRSADYTGRIAKWSTILGAFNIKYIPQTSVKGQVLADLIAKFVEPPNRNSNRGAKHGWKIGWHNLRARTLTLESVCWWRSKPKGVGGRASSNISWEDYHREIIEIRVLGHKQQSWIWGLGKVMEVFSDSRLVVGQVKGELEAKDVRMQGYLS